MLYRTLGRTGLNVSQLGFGAMRLPMNGEGESARVDLERAIPMIHRAFEGGVNYIDTAIFYCNGDSQRAVGEALKGWRERVIVSTKNHLHDPGREDLVGAPGRKPAPAPSRLDRPLPPSRHRLEVLPDADQERRGALDDQGARPGAGQTHLLLVS